MQIDAHVTFVQDWDVNIINQFESTHNEMAVLSTYLTDIVGSIDENGRSKRDTRPIMCNTGMCFFICLFLFLEKTNIFYIF